MKILSKRYSVPPSCPQGRGLRGARAHFPQVPCALLGRGPSSHPGQSLAQASMACFELAPLILPFDRGWGGGGWLHVILPPSAPAVQACVAGRGLRAAGAASRSCPASSANTSGCLVLIRTG